MDAERGTILANGESREIELPCSVADFLKSCSYKSTQVVIEYNGNVLERKSLGTVMLRNGDQLEVIVPVAGG